MHLAGQKAKASGWFFQSKSLIACQIVPLWGDEYLSGLLILSKLAGTFLVLGVFREKRVVEEARQALLENSLLPSG